MKGFLMKEVFFKKELSNRIRNFLIENFPMRPELVFFITLCLLRTQNWFFLWREMQFSIDTLIGKNLNLKKSNTKSEQNHANYRVLTQTLAFNNSSKKKTK